MKKCLDIIVTLDSVLTKEEHKQIMLECQN